jgi:hypothetical protein
VDFERWLNFNFHDETLFTFITLQLDCNPVVAFIVREFRNFAIAVVDDALTHVEAIRPVLWIEHKLLFVVHNSPWMKYAISHQDAANRFCINDFLFVNHF